MAKPADLPASQQAGSEEYELSEENQTEEDLIIVPDGPTEALQGEEPRKSARLSMLQLPQQGKKPTRYAFWKDDDFSKLMALSSGEQKSSMDWVKEIVEHYEVIFDEALNNNEVHAGLITYTEELEEQMRSKHEEHNQTLAERNSLQAEVTRQRAEISKLNNTNNIQVGIMATLQQRIEEGSNNGGSQYEWRAPSTKTGKLPDVVAFIGIDPITKKCNPIYEHWEGKMKRKFEANPDYHSTEILRIAYVEARVQGDAAKHLNARLHPDAVNKFKTADEMFQVLRNIYGNKHRKEEARKEYRNIRQAFKDGGQPFNEFYADFSQLALELGIDEETQLSDLKGKVNFELRSAMIAILTEDLGQWAEIARKIDSDQRELRSSKERRSKNTYNANIGSDKGDKDKDNSNYKGLRKNGVYPSLAIEKLYKAGCCTNCGIYGHRKHACRKPPSEITPEPQLNTVPEERRAEYIAKFGKPSEN